MTSTLDQSGVGGYDGVMYDVCQSLGNDKFDIRQLASATRRSTPSE